MVVDIEDHACPCCRNELHRIGEHVSERLDIVPAQLRVLVVRRPKYGCRACENVVVQAPAPARLIEGGFAKRLEDGKFRWPNVHDGVMRLSAAELSALLEGLDWKRVHAARETPAPIQPA